MSLTIDTMVMFDGHNFMGYLPEKLPADGIIVITVVIGSDATACLMRQVKCPPSSMYLGVCDQDMLGRSTPMGGHG